jgi:hypothetical protein
MITIERHTAVASSRHVIDNGMADPLRPTAASAEAEAEAEELPAAVSPCFGRVTIGHGRGAA